MANSSMVSILERIRQMEAQALQMLEAQNSAKAAPVNKGVTLTGTAEPEEDIPEGGGEGVSIEGVSMEGPPPRNLVSPSRQAVKKESSPRFKIGAGEMRRAVIMSEILSPPVSRRNK